MEGRKLLYSLRVEHIGTQREECEHSHRSIIIDLGELLLLISVCLHTRCGPSTEAACTSCWGSDIETRRRRGFRASQPYCSLLLPCTIWTQPAARSSLPTLHSTVPHTAPSLEPTSAHHPTPAPSRFDLEHDSSLCGGHTLSRHACVCLRLRAASLLACALARPNRRGSPSNSQLSKTLVAGGWLRLVPLSCAFVLPGVRPMLQLAA